ncbi:MAG: SUMF1/EgtB/PvdO family nonheme iron enzyme, partial [Desulfobacterales bacterium]|nr:SUMF1/EgtB/PvdO family nonheme iron enzyme [Desulfobacterales bacterium]
INPVNLSTPDTLTVNSVTPTGAYDMAGNVYEWCHDWYQINYYTNSPESNPTGAIAGTGRVLRGGVWHKEHWVNRATYRHFQTPGVPGSGTGFRICVSPE